MRVNDGIHITPAADGYGNNVLAVRVKGTVMRDGIVLSNTLDSTGQWVGSPIIISGSLEACTRYPIYAEEWNNGEIQDFYLLDLNDNYGFYLKNCRQIKITSADAGNDEGTVCGLENCENVAIENCRVTYLNIDGACRGTALNNLVVVKALNDLAPDTDSSGWIKQRSAPYQMMDSKPQDRTNLFHPVWPLAHRPSRRLGRQQQHLDQVRLRDGRHHGPRLPLLGQINHHCRPGDQQLPAHHSHGEPVRR